MNDLELRDYANRQWSQISGHDRLYWVAEYQRNGYLSTQKASQSLWQHMKAIRNEWPDDKDRKQDLDYHIAFNKLLDRIADALSSGRTILRP
jgi:hypothetical protein